MPNAVNTYDGIQSGLKEMDSFLPNNMCEDHNYYTDRKRPVTRVHILRFHYIQFWTMKTNLH